MRTLAYAILRLLGLEIDGFPTEGIAAFGYWVRPRRSPSPGPYRGFAALAECLKLDIHSVLDVGSGAGAQARAFDSAGKIVTCVDLGLSVYARSGDYPARVRLVGGDFNEVGLDGTYDLVWSSHTLEHQRNVGQFLGKLIQRCNPGGWLCITVPVSHRALWGGHLTLWTPGLLVYNVVLCGVDASQARIIHGHREFSILLSPSPIELPLLSADKGDLQRLSPFLPPWCKEGADSW